MLYIPGIVVQTISWSLMTLCYFVVMSFDVLEFCNSYDVIMLYYGVFCYIFYVIVSADLKCIYFVCCFVFNTVRRKVLYKEMYSTRSLDFTVCFLDFSYSTQNEFWLLLYTEKCFDTKTCTQNLLQYFTITFLL